MVEKRGRPALNGARYESGRLKEPAGAERGENLFQRFRELVAIGLDPRLTSQIGRLRFLKLITDTQASAADKVGRVYGRYERLHGVRRSTRSPSYEFGTGGGLERPEDIERTTETDADYTKLQTCIPIFPQEARATIEALCVEDRVIPTSLLSDVRIVLDKIAYEFDLGEGVDQHQSGPKRRGDPTPPRFPAAAPSILPLLAPVRKQKPAKPAIPKLPKVTRQEKFEAGAYAACGADAVPVASCHHAVGSPAERDHAALVRRLEEAQRRREGEP